ncbi:MAG: DUF4147 domain-containing protein [Candidatus Riflebacteria bacterium]|nr:DUF4147 domain-containing protein [Candidatus Riflebacteria bacterium]
MIPGGLFAQLREHLQQRLSPRRWLGPWRGDLLSAAAIVAVGKAAPAFADAVAREPGLFARGFAVGPGGGGAATAGDRAPARWTFWAGDHPVPGPGSLAAARGLERALAAVDGPGAVVVLMSGGGSALLAAPAVGLTMEEKAAAHAALVRSGRSIVEINVVRRHLSAVKGGGLLRPLLAQGRPVLVLALSDVPGDRLHDIGSGPFCPDPTTFDEALAVSRAIPGLPAAALALLERGARGETAETLKPGEVPAGFWQGEILANQETALAELESWLQERGEATDRLPWTLAGPPGEWAQRLAAAARAGEVPPDRWLLARGETEVAMPPGVVPGRGGRASTLVLEMALALRGAGFRFGVGALATDGRDGNSGTAGGWLTADDLDPAEAVGEMVEALGRFDAGGFLDRRGRSWPAASTGTNLGDLLMVKIRAGTP